MQFKQNFSNGKNKFKNPWFGDPPPPRFPIVWTFTSKILTNKFPEVRIKDSYYRYSGLHCEQKEASKKGKGKKAHRTNMTALLQDSARILSSTLRTKQAFQ